MSESSTRQAPSDRQMHDGLIAGVPENTRSKGLAVIPFMRLVRIEYSLSGAMAVYLGALLAGGHVLSAPVLLSAIAVFLVASACYVFDDLADMDCDRKNERPDRPLVTGEVTLRSARTTGVVSLVLAATTATVAGTIASLLIVAGAITAGVYNRWLQCRIPLKNVLFAGAFPVVLLIGLLAAGGSLQPVFVYVLTLMFVVGLGFETMIDIADIEGDCASGVASFATRYGRNASSYTAAVLLIGAAILLLLLFFLPIDPRLQANPLFLILALPIAAFEAHIGVKLISPLSPHRVLALKRRLFLSISLTGLAIAFGLLVSAP